MEPVDIVRGRMAPLGRDDVDTDQIMPKEHLKRIDRTGYGQLIFDHWRRDPSFVLNDPAHADANVLLTGANFGCGSSREHAPWGLQQAGFDAIVASSFADIFRANCTNIGLLTVAVDPKVLRTLLRIAAEDPEAVVEIDLPSRRARIDHAVDAPFAIDDLSAQRLLEGRDRVTDTLERLAAIEAFEERREEWLPVTD